MLNSSVMNCLGLGGETSRVKLCEANLTMELCQLLVSVLHAWGLDPDLDRLCESKLGLLRPRVPISFGVISKAGMFIQSNNKVLGDKDNLLGFFLFNF